MVQFTERERAYIRLGSRAEREGRFDLAEAIYRRWMREGPPDVRPAFGLAQLLLARGDYINGLALHEARRYILRDTYIPPEPRPEPLPLPDDVDPRWRQRTIPAEEVERLLDRRLS